MKVYITRPVPKIAVALLKKEGYAVSMYTGADDMPQKELHKKVKGVHAILSILTTLIDEAVMDAAGPQLKVIANFAVGYDNIDVAAAKKRTIAVTNTPAPEISSAVADHTVALIISLARRIVEADAYVRKGKYTIWDPGIFIGMDLSGKTLGLVGLGRIGKAVAHRLADGFGMKVLYTDIVRDREFEKLHNVRFVSHDELYAQSDIVSLHVPLLPQTHHLINAKTIKMMKKGVLIINTARGPVIDQKALLAALQSGYVGGAGLDVFDCEPALACSAADVRAYRKLSNLIVTPHIASATVHARNAMAQLAAESITLVLQGKKSPYALS